MHFSERKNGGGVQADIDMLHSILPLNPTRNMHPPRHRTSETSKNVIPLHPTSAGHGAGLLLEDAALGAGVDAEAEGEGGEETKETGGHLRGGGERSERALAELQLRLSVNVATRILKLLAHMIFAEFRPQRSSSTFVLNVLTLDMMGPRTLEGGYSPSHVISSNSVSDIFKIRGEGVAGGVKVERGEVVRALERATKEAGAVKPVEMARIERRRRRVSENEFMVARVGRKCGRGGG